jgi:hypothetical protein
VRGRTRGGLSGAAGALPAFQTPFGPVTGGRCRSTERLASSPERKKRRWFSIERSSRTTPSERSRSTLPPLARLADGCRTGSGRSERLTSGERRRHCRDRLSSRPVERPRGISAGGRHAGPVRGGGLSVSRMIAATWCSGMGRIPVHHRATFGCGIPSNSARRLPDTRERAIRERNSAASIRAVGVFARAGRLIVRPIGITWRQVEQDCRHHAIHSTIAFVSAVLCCSGQCDDGIGQGRCRTSPDAGFLDRGGKVVAVELGKRLSALAARTKVLSGAVGERRNRQATRARGLRPESTECQRGGA